jgi:hypothetical protein
MSNGLSIEGDKKDWEESERLSLKFHSSEKNQLGCFFLCLSELQKMGMSVITGPGLWLIPVADTDN